MRLTDNSILEELKASGNLPSPTGVALTILEMTRDPEVGTDDLAKVLKGDPALTGRILKYANSANSGSRTQVVVLRDALVRLGLVAVRQLCLSFSILSNARRGPCAAFDYERYWTHSLAMAVSCQSLLKFVRALNPDEGFTCGLLARIGRLALASVYPDEYAEVLAQSDGASPARVAEWEVSAMGLTHIDASCALLGDWRLPDAVIEATRNQEDGTWATGTAAPAAPDRERQLARVLFAANLAADICVETGARRDLLMLDFLKAGLSLGFQEDQLVAMYDDILAEWARMGSVLDIVTSNVPSMDNLVRRARANGGVIDDRNLTSTQPDGTEPSDPGDSTDLHTHAVADELAAPGEEKLDILVVTDSPIELKILTSKLQTLGYRVTGATDGHEALELALKTGPHLILSDWMLPRMDGLELCRTLRSSTQTQGVYFIINTSNDSSEDLVEGFDAGINDYVVKPLNLRILAARLRGASQVIRLREQSLRDREAMRLQLLANNKLNRRLETLALVDQLTGLPNRRAGLGFLESAWARATRTGEAMLVMMMDIDHFKKVNDTWGHDAGDVVLTRTAAAIQGAVRGEDRVSRHGGEEFLAVCQGADIEAAKIVGERIRKKVEDNQIDSLEFKGRVTISIGVSVRSPEHKCPADMIRDADEALYAVKNSGRNNVGIKPPQQP